MAKAKRNTKPCTMKMGTATFERLGRYCEESGQTKTVAVERATNAYIDDYLAQKDIGEKYTDK